MEVGKLNDNNKINFFLSQSRGYFSKQYNAINRQAHSYFEHPNLTRDGQQYSKTEKCLLTTQKNRKKHQQN